MEDLELEKLKNEIAGDLVLRFKESNNEDIRKYVFDIFAEKELATIWQLEYIYDDILEKSKQLIWAKERINNNQEISQEEANKAVSDAYQSSFTAFLCLGIFGFIWVPSIKRKLKKGLDNNTSDIKTARLVEKMISIHTVLFFVALLYIMSLLIINL